MRCPACGRELSPFQTTAGLVLRCEQGHGTSVNVAVLRRRFDETLALWRTASRQPQGSRPCPSCARAMRAFSWQAQQPVELDACSICQLVWFDAAEIEALKIRLVERTPGTSAGLATALGAGGSVAVASSEESSWLERRLENVVDGLDPLWLLEFFDF